MPALLNDDDVEGTIDALGAVVLVGWIGALPVGRRALCPVRRGKG